MNPKSLDVSEKNIKIFWLNQISNLFRNNYQNFFYKNASRSRLVSHATMMWSALYFHDLRDCSKYPYRYNWINRKFFISLWSRIILWDFNTALKYDSKLHFSQKILIIISEKSRNFGFNYLEKIFCFREKIFYVVSDHKNWGETGG